MNQNTQCFKDETAKSFFKNTNKFKILQEFVMLSYSECAVYKAGTIIMRRTEPCAANQPNTYTTAQ